MHEKYTKLLTNYRNSLDINGLNVLVNPCVENFDYGSCAGTTAVQEQQLHICTGGYL